MEKKWRIQIFDISILYASIPVNDTTVISEEYNHTDHCVCKKEEHYQCIWEISFQLISWKWMKITFLLFMQIFKGMLTVYFFPETYISTEKITLTCSWRWRQGQEEDSGKFLWVLAHVSGVAVWGLHTYIEGKGKYQ